jgi:hypothetical protein
VVGDLDRVIGQFVRKAGVSDTRDESDVELSLDTAPGNRTQALAERPTEQALVGDPTCVRSQAEIVSGLEPCAGIARLDRAQRVDPRELTSSAARRLGAARTEGNTRKSS